MLDIRNLFVEIDGKLILNGLNLKIQKGEIHAIMGPNGAGKSTLAKVLAGDPAYEVKGGEILFEGQNILELAPEERSHLGLFMSFQYPVEIAGISNLQFLHAAYNAKLKAQGKVPVSEEVFGKILEEKMAVVEQKDEFKHRSLNEGFSGGEKKRNEILQMAVLAPRLAILDETDSGLDIDALRVVADGVNSLRRPDNATVVVTHYQRLLNYIVPDYVHVLSAGRIVRSGGKDLALELEARGYDWLTEPATAGA